MGVGEFLTCFFDGDGEELRLEDGAESGWASDEVEEDVHLLAAVGAERVHEVVCAGCPGDLLRAGRSEHGGAQVQVCGADGPQVPLVDEVFEVADGGAELALGSDEVSDARFLGQGEELLGVGGVGGQRPFGENVFSCCDDLLDEGWAFVRRGRDHDEVHVRVVDQVLRVVERMLDAKSSGDRPSRADPQTDR